MSEDEVTWDARGYDRDKEEEKGKGKAQEEMPKRGHSIHSGEVLCYDENGDPVRVVKPGLTNSTLEDWWVLCKGS